jgi:LPXTG-motif cell wall-anchored protein
MILIRRGLVLLAVVLCAFSFAPAAHAQYQPGTPGIVLTPSTTTPFEPVTAIGFGCPKGSTVVITIDGERVGQTTTKDDERGSFETKFPAPGTPGTYTVTATCGSTLVSSILTVIATPTTPTTVITTVELPITGSDSTMFLVRAGLLLIAVGGLTVLAVRRRRES